MINVYQAFQLIQTVNVHAQEENISTATYNALVVLEIVQSVLLKPIVPYVLLISIYKMENVLKDVTQDISFQERFVKNVNKDVLIVKKLVLV